MNTSVATLTLLAVFLGTAAVADTIPVPVVTDQQFCAYVQQVLAGTEIAAENTVYADPELFKQSKTHVRPLTIHQFVQLDPAAAGTPTRVSCKVKTPDHLVAEYGPEAAYDSGQTCRDVNRRIAVAVYEDLYARGVRGLRVDIQSISFDDDETTIMGSRWLAPFEHVYRGDDGRLHIRAKALRVDWDDIWLSWAPERFRGAFYCHFVAPEYWRRIFFGDVTVSSAQP